MAPRRSKRHPLPLRRSKGTRSVKPTHWVFCEGSTEARCVEDLRQHYRMSSVNVRVEKDSGVPMTVVNRAIEKKKELTRNKSSIEFTVYAVFDRDEHPNFRAAIQKALDNGIHLGVSVPCIELWALLLHGYHSSYIERSEAQRKLAKVHPKYSHKNNPYFEKSIVISKRMQAGEHSEKLRKRALENHGCEFANPSTNFSDVLESIFGKD